MKEDYSVSSLKLKPYIRKMTENRNRNAILQNTEILVIAEKLQVKLRKQKKPSTDRNKKRVVEKLKSIRYPFRFQPQSIFIHSSSVKNPKTGITQNNTC